MFDNICSLPLTSDLFAQAVHPTEPILSVGLASGHVQTYRLPPIADSINIQHHNRHATSGFIGTSISQNGSEQSVVSATRRRSSSVNGFGTIDTAWRTRRHKGSCRTLAFSSDGELLFSAGTDGLVKVAATETGRVVAKVAIPMTSISQTLDAPSLLHALTPQTLLLGTDTGRLNVYDLRIPSHLPMPRPQQTLRPHAAPKDLTYSEPITSVTPLPPTATSTSGTSRQWISTSGSTLAVSDLRKGAVSVSEDQGDVLLSSVCVNGVPTSATTRNGVGNGGEKVLVGGANGVLTLWDRGRWADQRGRVIVHRDGGSVGDEGTLDCLAIVPRDVGERTGYRGNRVVAVGLGNGVVRFVQLRGGGGMVVGEVSHDERRIEGVAALDFDVAGRMISGGGQIVKVWHELVAGEVDGQYEDQAVLNGLGAGADGGANRNDSIEESGNSDSDSSSASDEAPKRKKKRRRKNGEGGSKHGEHGIMAFKGLD